MMNLRKNFGRFYVHVKNLLFKILPHNMYPIIIKICAKIELNEKMNISNPCTFNEKIQWLKLFDINPLKSDLADKYKVRDWVSKKIGKNYLVPLLGVWENFEDINFDILPSKFVLKATHGCSCNIIVENKSDFDKKDAEQKFKKWFATNYAYNSGEIHYESIKPRIIAEEYIENQGGDLYDYKVFCFNGKAKYIMFLCDRKAGLKMAFYDVNWCKQPFTYSYPMLEEEIEKPDCLSELIEKAETLAEGFDCVRVDFYILNDGRIKFGEMTFASAGGFCKWNPPEYNEILGRMIRISKDQI